MTSTNCPISGTQPLLIWKTMLSDKQATCDLGFYCPNIIDGDDSTYPAICPPTPECKVIRLKGEYCPTEYKYEPQICPQGYYCPDFRQKIECPANHWCPYGTTTPIPCEDLSICPAGSNKRIYYGSAVFILIVYFILYVIIKFDRYYNNRRFAMLKYRFCNLSADSTSSSLTNTTEQQHSSFSPIQSSTSISSTINNNDDDYNNAKILCQGFDSCRTIVPYLDITMKDLKLSLPNGRILLENVNGVFSRGKMTAIMGPSGAGKTTLLNKVRGSIDSSWPTSGQLLINGRQDNINDYHKIIGFVPQDVIVDPYLSVWDNILYSARIRLPTDWSDEKKQQHAYATMHAMRLADYADLSINPTKTNPGLSFSQAKRLNIAVELAAAPLCLFLDEPTTSLDSNSALNLCLLLKRLAIITNITIIIVIHQPRKEIWSALDELLVLAPGGKSVYLGPQSSAQQYLEQSLNIKINEQENPADLLMDIVSIHGDALSELWINKGGPTKLKQIIQSSTSSSKPIIDLDVAPVRYTLDDVRKLPIGARFYEQFFFAHIRGLRQQLASIQSFYIEMFISFVLGAVMGGSVQFPYQGQLIAPYTSLSAATRDFLVAEFGMYTAMTIAMAAATAGVKVFSENRKIFWREFAAGHNKLAYFLGQSTAVVFRFVYGALHFSFSYHFLSGAPIKFDRLFSLVFLIFFNIYGFASIVSMIVAPQSAALVSVVITFFLTIFCGYVSNLPKFLQVITSTYWSSEAFFSDQTIPFRHVMKVESISARRYDWTLDQFEFDMAMMFIIGSIYRLIAYFLMVNTNKTKQR